MTNYLHAICTTTMASALFVSASAFAAMPPKVTLNCGKVAGIKTKANLIGGDIYAMNVVFIGKRPQTKEIDKALRECLAVAVQRDGSKDILATPWFREKVSDESVMLNPYGSDTSLVWQASTKSIKIHKINF